MVYALHYPNPAQPCLDLLMWYSLVLFVVSHPVIRVEYPVVNIKYSLKM